MRVTDDVKQAVQAFLVPELDAIKAQNDVHRSLIQTVPLSHVSVRAKR